VTVRYGVNSDRARWGFHLLGDQAVSDTDGFPVCEAVVTYPLEGYGAYLGWIQVLDIMDTLSGDKESLVDIPPMFAEPVTPFIAFGPEPRFFDAPATVSTDNVRLEWRATAYLCAAGHVLMTPEVQPVTGFSWGFTYEPGLPVLVREPTPAAPGGWDQHRTVLTKALPAWTFSNEEPQHQSLAL
jgi:hypothetical protein